MSVLRVWPVLVLAAVLAACSGDDPAAVPEAQPRAVQAVQVSEPAAEEGTQEQTAGSVRAEVVEPAVEAVEQASGVEEVEGSPRDEAAQDLEPSSTEGAAGSAVAEPIEQASGEEMVEDSSQEEDAHEAESGGLEGAGNSAVAEREVEEEPAEDLTDLPGVVLVDADVRVRPGLAWPMVDRLPAGEPVVVLHGGGGWYRISYGDGLGGWIRSTAVDLGGIDEWSVLRQAAPAILAEWRGVEYGVMGQSADGAEVRLLAVDDEWSEILGAPKDEVSLLAEDVSLEDLPILIGYETVVFPGDDFRVGQGRILPTSDQWLWLDDGSLLAHNETHVWRWQPETDELEFTSRAPGFAKFSPDGRYMAIARLCPRDLECSQDNSVAIHSLDGTRRITFDEEVSDLEVAGTLGLTVNEWVPNLTWSGNSKAVSLSVALFDGEWDPRSPTTLLFHIEGQMSRFEMVWERELEGHYCYVEPPYPGSAVIGIWEFRDDDTIASDAFCIDADGRLMIPAVVFTLKGEFARLDSSWHQGISVEEDARLRSAQGGDALGERIGVLWSPTRQHAVVNEHATGRSWLYSAQQHVLRAIVVESSQVATRMQTWPPVEPDADPHYFSWAVYWFNEERALAVAIWDGYWVHYVRGAMVLDLSTAVGQELDLGSWPWTHWRRAASWNHTGELLQMTSSATVVPQADAMEGLYVFQLLILERDGSFRSEIVEATACADGGFYQTVPRHRAEWSPNGAWFAVGGEALDGRFPCPDREW